MAADAQTREEESVESENSSLAICEDGVGPFTVNVRNIALPEEFILHIHLLIIFYILHWIFISSFINLLIHSIFPTLKLFYTFSPINLGLIRRGKLGYFLNIKYYLKNQQTNNQILEFNLTYKGVFKIYLYAFALQADMIASSTN